MTPLKPKPKTTSFTQMVTRGSALVYDLRVKLNGEMRYFIIKVTPATQKSFLNAVEKDEGFRLEDYGDILHRGWDEPDDELKAQLREEYGMYQDKPGEKQG